MQFSAFRLYRIFPYFWTFTGLCLAVIFFAKGYSGSPVDRERLSILSDLARSVGIFLVGIPALATIGSSQDRQAQGWTKLFLCLNLLAELLSIYFLFGYSNSSYIGFEQNPENGAAVFLIALLLSVLSALTALVKNITENKGRAGIEVVPYVFLFSAIGICGSLLVLQIIPLASGDAKSLYDATIPASEFLKQLTFVGALSVLIFRIIEDHDRVVQSGATIGGIFLLLGFQNSAILQNQSELIFVFNQLVAALGVSIIFAVTVRATIRKWKRSAPEILNRGQWVGHLGLVLVLGLTILIQLGMGKLILAGGILDSVRLILATIALPLIFAMTMEHRPPYSVACHSISSALLWCGLFIATISILVVSPFGASVPNMNFSAFYPYFGMALAGLFMLLLGCIVLIWDRILGEAI